MKTFALSFILFFNSSFVITQAATGPGEVGSLNQTTQDIVDVASHAGIFNTLIAAVQSADLESVLRGDGPFTVFAPTDDAFAALPKGTIEILLQPENRDLLVDILTLHVVQGEIRSTDLLTASSAETLNGKSVSVGLRVMDATVIQADVDASNGVIHVIDSVLLPRDLDVSRLMSALPASRIIERSINSGAPMYNGGNHSGTANLYRETAMALIDHGDISHRSRRMLRSALNQVEATHSWDDRAWIMRRALDRVYASLHH